jgi:hypothetical protein
MRHPLRLLPLLAILLAVSGVLGSQDFTGKIEPDPEPLQKVLWTAPGASETFDFQFGPGGPDHQPQPPFRFLNEDMSRTTPKLNVIDSRGVTWNIKWGHEARPSAFCTRLIRACGYFASTEYFVRAGRIDGTPRLNRARSHVDKNGSFVDARFQLRSASPKFLPDERWSLTDNPFVGTPELQGLKILILLLSNWDTRDSNFTIFSETLPDEDRALYVHSDWGAALGAWGSYFTRSKGNCRDFTKQTARFVKGVQGGAVEWGFGKITDIRVSDVQWLLPHLGRITDAQFRAGLLASGETTDDAECYTRALRQRIQQLQRVAE